MSFRFAEIIAYLSRLMRLLRDDLIAKGTPRGVGVGMKPQPLYLKRGDETAGQRWPGHTVSSGRSLALGIELP